MASSRKRAHRREQPPAPDRPRRRRGLPGLPGGTLAAPAFQGVKPPFERGSLIALALMAVVVVGPYFRGLYFPGEQLLAALALTLLFALRWLQKFAAEDYAFVSGPLDVLVWALAGAYLVALVVAVELRAAVQELIKVTAYATAYWLAQDLARSRAAVRWLLHAVLLAGAYVATLGVAAAAGHFTLKDAILGNRIASTLQYPNSLAAYLTVAFLIGVTLWQTSERRWERAWAAAASYGCLFVIVFTYSRGGWLVFALAVPLFWLVQPAGLRLRALASLAWLAVILPPFAYLYTKAFAAHTAAVAAAAGAAQAAGAAAAAAAGAEASVASTAAAIWLAYLGGWPLAAAGPWLVDGFMRLGVAVRSAVVGAAATALASVVLYVAANPSLLPEPIVARLRDINLETYSAWTRIQWSRDALAMIAQRPVLGGGGGAWEALYHAYQSYNYFSRQVHNHFFQVWLEVGTVGFLVWLALWVALAAAAWRAYRAAADAGGRALVAGAALAAFAMGLHSLIDFNLALSAVALTLWTVFGAVRALEKIHTGFYQPSNRRSRRAGYALWPRLAVYGLSAALALGQLSLYAGYVQGQLGAAALREGDAEAAGRHFDRALALDPLTASFYFDRATVYEMQGAEDARALAEARRLMERGLRLDPYDANLHTLYGAFLLRHGAVNDGLAALRRAAELHPFETERWKNLARAEWLVGLDLLRRAEEGDGDTAALEQQARNHLAAALDVAVRVQELRERVPERMRRADFAPEVTPEIALYAGQAAALLGRWEEAEAHLRHAVNLQDERSRASALMWLGAVLDRTGRAEEAQQLLQQAYALDPELEPVFHELVDRLKQRT